VNKVVEERTKRTEWYRDARFGMFIHWGLYAIPARGEWLRSVEELTMEEYEPFIDEFTADNFDPKEWARLAKKAGMKYAVLTAKHHDGFCLYDSKLTDFKSTNSPCGRDIVREFLDAFRAEGIRVGLYFSIIDWRHPDYPHYGDMHHPMRNHPECSNENRNFENYLDYMFGQIRELLTNYGKLDVMWFDFSYGEMKGDKWKAAELVDMIRSLQPHLIIDNRLEGSGEDGGSIKKINPTTFSGDFASPEQMIPPEGILDEAGNPIPWEACVTLNEHWGYSAQDMHYKSSKMIIRMLVECVSKGGNLLLNVGPDAKGEIPEESVKILEDVGHWMKQNSRSIYGCGYAGLPKPEWGRYTRNGNRLYAHVMEEQTGAVCLEGMAGKVEKMRLVRDNSEVKESSFWNLAEYSENAFFSFHQKGNSGNPPMISSYPLPDEVDTVVEVFLKEE
jgi:alpha-L-fucosidase